jgi:iron complex outermembrane recepter protein
VMFQGSVASGRQRPLWFDLRSTAAGVGSPSANALSETQVADVLGRWTRTSANGSSFQVQAYFDMSRRTEAIGSYDRDTWDIDAQYHDTLGPHNIVVGGGYRHIAEAILGQDPYTFTPGQARSILTNGFVQDSITVGPRVEVTLGAKYESNTFAASGFQPNVRALWKVAARQRMWAAASRALRTPSLIDRGLHVQYPLSSVPTAALTPSMALLQNNPAALGLPPGLPILVGAVGNPDVERERFVNVEAGYRVSVGSMATIDAVAFTGRYDGLQTYEPLPPEVTLVGGGPAVAVLTQIQNRLRARTRGAELVGRLQLTDSWETDGTFSVFGASSDPNGSLDPAATAFDGHAPSYQWRAHSAVPLGPRGQADVHLFYVGPIRSLDIPGYTRLDARVEWRLTGQASLVGSGQNLLQDTHPEFNGQETAILATSVPRSGTLALAWRF